MFSPVDDKRSFASIEEEVLAYWESIDAFQTSLKLNKDKPEFKFYDGPPFATGLPHYGHILAGTIKDVVCRYAHMTGHNVPRRFGWDCHGLPVEHEMDKTLGITDRHQIEEMGIGVYNEKCRSIVMKYSSEWRKVITRAGRWIDFDNDYKTLNTPYMESIWWVFKQLWDKGYVYRGVKVMPYSVGCSTPLSNFEASQDYREVSDPAITVAFETLNEDFEIAAWTTTPWTLPSNLILAVNQTMTYVKVETKEGRKLVMMKDRLCQLFNLKKPDFKILEEFPGSRLVGVEYKPIFNYFEDWRANGAFKVYAGDFVDASTGTGIVHCAPGFGEDDFNLCLKVGVIRRDGEIPCPIDEAAKYTDKIPEYQGIYVKDADKPIIKELKARGRLLLQSTINHSYPYCWRSHTPLIYRTIPSWFVRVEGNNEKLLENALNTHWVPPAILNGRFAEWLRNARDWAISRSRFWGTPIPIWTTDDFSEFIVIGSIEELQQYAGRTFTDIHRHFIDDVEITSPTSGKKLHRIPEVFDCWFESGSMPFAQDHIPFSGQEWRQADFIAEGLDQTRGWFYSLLVISTLLDHPAPFQNVIVNGLILDKFGKKFSKSAKNYPDPMLLINQNGADCLRIYLINSPAVRAEPLKFNEETGIPTIMKDVMIPWLHSYKFFVQQAIRHGNEFHRNEALAYSSTNTLDIWILARLNQTIKLLHDEMRVYHLYAILPHLLNFLEDLKNWYIKLNRSRMKSAEEHEVSLSVLFEALYGFTVLMAPFAPMFSEHIYQTLRPCLGDSLDSIHFTSMLMPKEEAINENVIRKVHHFQNTILVGRLIRDHAKLPIKRPMKSFTIVCSEEIKNEIDELIPFVKSELNILEIKFDHDEQKHMKFTAYPDGKVLGRRLRQKLKAVINGLNEMPHDVLADLYTRSLEARAAGLPPPECTIAECVINTDEMHLTREFNEPTEKNLTGALQGDIAGIADTDSTPLIDQMSIARELRSCIQHSRKSAGLEPNDKIFIVLVDPQPEVVAAVNSEEPLVRKSLDLQVLMERPEGKEVIGEYETPFGSMKVLLLRDN